MIHEEQRMQISQYVDGELDPSTEREVFDHLGGCVECRGFLRRSIRLRADMIGEPLRLQDCPRRHIDSRKSLPQRHTRSILRRSISFPVPIAAAIMLILIAGSVALSFLWSKTQTVYVTAFPAVEVRAYMP
jgi:anti-sigma factor RsiW